MRQGSAADLISCRCPRLKTLELDEKMRSRDGHRTNLFQTDCRTKSMAAWMRNCLAPEICRCKAGLSLLFPLFFQNATSIEDLQRNRSLQFYKPRRRLPPLPQSAKLRRGLIPIDQSQIPSQQSCW